MYDLIIKNVNLPDGRKNIDIGIHQQKIASIESNLDGTTKQIIDASGCLLSPPFIDAHFHLDATLSLLPESA